jgi:hypothetical protein
MQTALFFIALLILARLMAFIPGDCNEGRN